jgi:hypothetical protein
VDEGVTDGVVDAGIGAGVVVGVVAGVDRVVSGVTVARGTVVEEGLDGDRDVIGCSATGVLDSSGTTRKQELSNRVTDSKQIKTG